ncbi:hypothetical protein L1049_016228 [Liquidambar formosana]|uniref:Uncharacterized protein n=1 Tax=Liquidambar formosana TaxID=63359 RepID=A0AAP0S0Y1_LIQFO
MDGDGNSSGGRRFQLGESSSRPVNADRTRIRRRRERCISMGNFQPVSLITDHSGALFDCMGKRKFYFPGDPWDPTFKHNGRTYGYSFNTTGIYGLRAKELKWPLLFHLRYEYEAKCRWEGLRVPKARSVQIQKEEPGNVVKLCERLERETEQMRRRLDRAFWIYYHKQNEVDPTEKIKSIMEKPNLMSDPELSDYSISDNGSDNEQSDNEVDKSI